MDFITGDAQGFVKKLKLRPRSEKFGSEDLRLLSTKLPEPEVSRVPGFEISLEVFGEDSNVNNVDFVALCQNIARFETSGDTLLIVGRSSGVVDILDGTDGSNLCSYPVFVPSPDVLDRRKRQECFIGLFVSGTTVVAATSRGLVAYLDLTVPFPQPEESSNPLLPYSLFHLKQQELCSFSLDPTNSNRFATGGLERELAVWDISEHVKADGAAKNSEKLTAMIDLVPQWKAKNVKNDKLDLQAPVWVTAISWLSSHELLISTGHGIVRKYDTSQNRRPQLQHRLAIFEDHPITGMTVCPRFLDSVFLCDNTGTVVRFNWVKGVSEGRYKGATGAIKAMQIVSDVAFSQTKNKPVNVLVAVGIDRTLRMWNIDGKHALLGQIFLTQHTNCVLASRHDETCTLADEDEHLWQQMEKVEEPLAISKRRRLDR